MNIQRIFNVHIASLIPADTKPNDRWYWHTTLIFSDLNEIFQKLKDQGYTIRSKNLVKTGFSDQSGNSGFMARDSDDHYILFVENKGNPLN